MTVNLPQDYLNKIVYIIFQNNIKNAKFDSGSSILAKQTDNTKKLQMTICGEFLKHKKIKARSPTFRIILCRSKWPHQSQQLWGIYHITALHKILTEPQDREHVLHPLFERQCTWVIYFRNISITKWWKKLWLLQSETLCSLKITHITHISVARVHLLRSHWGPAEWHRQLHTSMEPRYLTVAWTSWKKWMWIELKVEEKGHSHAGDLKSRIWDRKEVMGRRKVGMEGRKERK